MQVRCVESCREVYYYFILSRVWAQVRVTLLHNLLFGVISASDKFVSALGVERHVVLKRVGYVSSGCFHLREGF